MPPRIPTEADFAPLAATLPHALHFPSPRESTTAILVLLHGLGDTEAPFASFARSMNLPGVLAVSVRGMAVLPPSMLPDAEAPAPTPALASGAGAGGDAGTAATRATATGHYHWGDDLSIDPATGDVDADPGFARATRRVMDELVRGVLVDRCGWELSDVLLFGFGQGGSLALALAASLAKEQQVVDVTKADEQRQAHQQHDAAAVAATTTPSSFKGVVSIGGPLPPSAVSTRAARDRCRTSALVCQLDDEQSDYVRREFRDVRVVRWPTRADVDMPRNRDEMLPIMKFLAERLQSGW
ncbi:putative tRNA pseudouridine synthase 4 [Purpureocillium lavendulum]|uniref:tRNA pseudouridine synthase 4 n=1 Tax=Purpureocillium lavendulum TaxID=1247861 RepID=A0AB34FHW1_9HYPO|nr:putative tRNA pseudouridine synthase 4 [Purpureocillium lavendulum]